MSSLPPPTPPQAPHFPPLPPQYAARPKNWFDRNWKWLVPTLVVGFVLVIGGFFAAVFLGVTHMFTGSEPYKVAVERAMKSPAVQEKIGTPIKVGWFTSGNENLNGSGGSANFSIPLSGPKGSGQITVEAKKSANRWTYQTLQFDVSGEDPPISLLDPTPPENSPSIHF